MQAAYWGYIASGVAILICIIIAIVAQVKISYAYDKYSKIKTDVELTGAELVDKLCGETGIKVRARKINGTLTDNYDLRTKMLSISAKNYDQNSIAGQAVVAHEFGHAMQDANNYFPLKLRHFAIKLSQFASSAFLPLIIAGILLEIFLTGPMVGNIVIYCVAGFYGLSVLVNLVTLPVEYNASKRAKKLLKENGMYSEKEMAGVNEVLNAAALTYVASLLVSLAFFARFLFILLGSRK